ncbi:MAG TPA: FecR family protein [Telluria sp.]|nr:FecR family protein [Telluria sp.]
MLKRLLALVSFALLANAAYAAEAGKVIFVAGEAKIVEGAAREGAPVQEGDMLSTGKDGFLYVKTLDDGLFILRPNTKARIVAYHVDAKDPKNTRIKLELLSGVARSRSGKAVKLARQNFRFNTPVAAIGVRGTDFTVFTDQDTSRVTVISGGIVVSGFVGACRPDGVGPCEGATSRELSAAQRGQLLQVRRGQAAPQMLQNSGAASPDQVSGPLPGEGIAGTGSTIAPSLDAKKSSDVVQAAAEAPPTPIPAPPPPVVTPSPPPVETGPPPQPVPEVPIVVPPSPPPAPGPVEPPLPDRKIVWGRWQPLLDKPADINLIEEKSKNDMLAVSGNFALFLTPGKDYVLPSSGGMGFELQDSEAYIYTEDKSGLLVNAASLENGALSVDFGKRTFSTSMDLVNGAEKINLHATGALSANGRMYGDSTYGRAGYINVNGVLSNEQGGSAAYVFDGRLDSKRTVNGATFWQSRQPTP